MEFSNRRLALIALVLTATAPAEAVRRLARRAKKNRQPIRPRGR